MAADKINLIAIERVSLSVAFIISSAAVFILKDFTTACFYFLIAGLFVFAIIDYLIKHEWRKIVLKETGNY